MVLLYTIRAHAYTLVQVGLTGHLPFVRRAEWNTFSSRIY